LPTVVSADPQIARRLAVGNALDALPQSAIDNLLDKLPLLVAECCREGIPRDEANEQLRRRIIEELLMILPKNVREYTGSAPHDPLTPQERKTTLLLLIFSQHRREGIIEPECIERNTRQIINDFLDALVLEQFLKRVSTEERLVGLSPEERVKGLSAEEQVKGLSADQLEALARHLRETNGSSSQG
jgi:hypothetical protein